MTSRIKYPKLTIVTIVYNAQNYIEQTIKSIVNQTYKNIEYIVVDGESNDRTMEIIKRYEKSIDKIISEPDRGIYDAMNKSIKLATGDFIWFINAGDEVYDSKTVENIFKNYDNEDVLYGAMQLINEDGSMASLFTVPKKLTYKDFIYGMVVSHQAIIIKKDIVSPYNLEYKVVSDHDWIISALKRAKKIKNTQMTISKYLLGGFSDKQFYKAWKEKLTIMLRQYGKVAYLLNILLFIKAILKKNIKSLMMRIKDENNSKC